MGNVFSNFLSRFAGSKDQESAEEESGEEVEYKGYGIRPTLRREGSQWLTAGVIVKRTEGGVQEHSFIRVDKHVTKDDAEAFSVIKAKQIIDEQGDRLFKDG